MQVLNRHTMIFGKKREGKSNFLQWLLTQNYPNHLVYDICREHDVDGINRYTPENRNGEAAREEFGGVIEKAVTGNDRDRRPDVLAAEELSRTAPNGGGAHDGVFDMVDLNAHYGIGFIGVARRPAQVDTDVVELADTLVLFYMDGDNDTSKLNAIQSGLGDEVESLEPYHYITVEGRERTRHEPVPEMDTTGEL